MGVDSLLILFCSRAAVFVFHCSGPCLIVIVLNLELYNRTTILESVDMAYDLLTVLDIGHILEGL